MCPGARTAALKQRVRGPACLQGRETVSSRGFGEVWLFQPLNLGLLTSITAGFVYGSKVKNPPANAGDLGSLPGSGRSSGGGNQATHSRITWKLHGQRSLVGYVGVPKSWTCLSTAVKVTVSITATIQCWVYFYFFFFCNIFCVAMLSLNCSVGSSLIAVRGHLTAGVSLVAELRV